MLTSIFRFLFWKLIPVGVKHKNLVSEKSNNFSVITLVYESSTDESQSEASAHKGIQNHSLLIPAELSLMKGREERKTGGRKERKEERKAGKKEGRKRGRNRERK